MGLRAHWFATLVTIVAATEALAAPCTVPAAPFMPTDPADIRAYADLLHQDFETYFAEAQAYFRCMEQERQRVFREAQQVTRAYWRLIEVVGE